MGSTVNDALSGAKKGFESAGPLGVTIGTLGGVLGGPGQRAADAQAQIAEAQLAEQQAQRQAATSAATPSAAEIAQLERSIALNEADVTRKQRLLDAADPALIEAGKQALAILQGGSASAAVLDPIKRQRAEGRQKLEDQLRRQLGSGYATSSAGIEALTKYDQATSDTLAQASQQSLGQLLGTTQYTEGAGNQQTNIANSANFSQMYGNQSNRMVSAINSTPITMAGAQFAGDLYSSQNEARTLQQLLGLGAAAGGAAMGSPQVASGGLSYAAGSGGSNSAGQSYNGGYFSRTA